MNNQMTSVQGERELLDFVESAVERFSKDSTLTTFGDLEPESYLAIRWGLMDDCVLVVKLDQYFQNRVYQRAILKPVEEYGK